MKALSPEANREEEEETLAPYSTPAAAAAAAAAAATNTHRQQQMQMQKHVAAAAAVDARTHGVDLVRHLLTDHAGVLLRSLHASRFTSLLLAALASRFTSLLLAPQAVFADELNEANERALFFQVRRTYYYHACAVCFIADSCCAFWNFSHLPDARAGARSRRRCRRHVKRQRCGRCS
jgi:hypothetical protein